MKNTRSSRDRGTSRGIRLPKALEEAIEAEAAARGQSWSATAVALLEEAMRLRRAPGIAFADGVGGRRAVVAGTGLDVWEVILTWQQVGRDLAELSRHYPWLSEMQLRAAIGYYQLYPEEIDARIALEEQWTPERVRREFPYATPRPPRE